MLGRVCPGGDGGPSHRTLGGATVAKGWKNPFPASPEKFGSSPFSIIFIRIFGSSPSIPRIMALCVLIPRPLLRGTILYKQISRLSRRNYLRCLRKIIPITPIQFINDLAKKPSSERSYWAYGALPHTHELITTTHTETCIDRLVNSHACQNEPAGQQWFLNLLNSLSGSINYRGRTNIPQKLVPKSTSVSIRCYFFYRISRQDGPLRN